MTNTIYKFSDAITLLLCFLIITSIACMGQNTVDSYHVGFKDSTKIANKDSLFIKTYSDNINITTGMSTRNFAFSLDYPNSLQLVLMPNEIQQLSLDLDYRFISVGISYSPNFLNNSDPIKGHTTRKSFGLSLNTNAWKFRFDYAKTKGFFVENTQDYDSSWNPGKPYIQLPELTNSQIGFQLSYNFNKRFSQRSITSGEEKQLRSAMSFIPSLYAYYFRLYDQPDTMSAVYASGDYLRDIDINLVLPFAGTLVFAKNRYVTTSIGPSIGVDIYQTNSLSAIGDDPRSKTLMSFGYLTRIGLGYTGRKWYFGSDAIYREYQHNNQADEKVVKLFYSLQFYVGFRINPPKFVKKSVDWTEKVAPVKL